MQSNLWSYQNVTPENEPGSSRFRSIITSAPPILQSNSFNETLSPRQLIEARKRKKDAIISSYDPVASRVHVLQKALQPIETDRDTNDNEKVVVLKATRRSRVEKPLSPIPVPLLTQSNTQYKLDAAKVKKAATNFAPLPAIMPSRESISSSDIDYTELEYDDVLHFIREMNELKGKCAVPSLNALHKKKLHAINHLATELGERRENFIKKNLNKVRQKDIEDSRFIYGVVRETNAAIYNPYDLKQVEQSETKTYPSFYTISQDNVTHIWPDHSDVITVETWMRERRIFFKMIKLGCFRKYRIWKYFNFWKKITDHLKVEKTGIYLSQCLFTLDDRIRRVIYKVQELCEVASSSSPSAWHIDIEGNFWFNDEIRLFETDIARTFSLVEFKDYQSRCLQAASENLSHLRNNVVEIVYELCKAIAEDAGMEAQYKEVDHLCAGKEAVKKRERERDKTLRKMFGNKDFYPDIMQIEQFQREKSRKEIDDDKPTYTEIQQWKTVMGKLRKIIVVVDNILHNLLTRICVRATLALKKHMELSVTSGNILEKWEEESKALEKKLQDEFEIKKMRRERERKEKILQGILVENEDDTTVQCCKSKEKVPKPPTLLPLIKTTLMLTPDFSLEFDPPQKELTESFKDIIDDYRALAGSFVSILHDEKLMPFVTRIKFEPALKSVPDPFEDWTGIPIDIVSLETNDDFKNASCEVHKLMDENISVVWEKSKTFSLYCDMVKDCMSLDVDADMNQKEWSTDDFRVVLAKYNEQVEAMKQIPEAVREGMVLLEMVPFRDSTLPYPLKILSDVHGILPVLAYRRNEDLLINIKDSTYRLEKECKDVSQFVEYLTFMSKLAIDLPSMEKEFTVIAKLYAIAGDFDVPLPIEELALYRTLLPSFTHLKTTLTYCEATRDELIKKYSKELDVQIRKLLENIKQLKNEVRHSRILADDMDAVTAIEQIKNFGSSFEKYSTKAHEYLEYQTRFGSNVGSRESRFSVQENINSLLNLEMTEAERDIRLRRTLWEGLGDWKQSLSTWFATLFHTVNVGEIQKVVKQKTQTIMLLEKALPANTILPQLKVSVEEFKESLPLLVALRNPALKARHLKKVEGLTGINVINDPGCLVSTVLESAYFESRTELMQISVQATNEATLEAMLQKVIEVWRGTEFSLVPYKDYTDLSVLSGVDEIQLSLEESLVTLSTIKGSKFVFPIQDTVDEWSKKLELFSATMDEWITCQRNWMYLESILTTPDIQRQLPREARLFNQVDKSWKELMRRVQERSNAIVVATTPGVLETLQSNNANLDKILKCLEDYLETKRLVFARFYFLSNEDILTILSNSKNPSAVQSKLTKCFGYIKKLGIFKEQNNTYLVKSLLSSENESIEFLRAVRARGYVESWLTQVEVAMKEIVKYTIKNAIRSYYTEVFEDWWRAQPGQISILVSRMIWNHLIQESFFNEDPLEKLKDLYRAWVDRLRVLSVCASTQKLDPSERIAVTSLITIEVHARDLLRQLIEHKITTPDDFDWVSQLRYTFDDIRDTALIRQNNFVSEYGYEFIGSTHRLVITPLTDRCVLTLTTALNLHLGGSPGGPAGTGKTETVKDLAKGFGKQCIVFNCSEGLDFKMLAQFFSGLTQSGSWFCFDEFNRIDVEVLSVVAQQLQILKRAKDAHQSRCIFEGHEIRVDPSCGFFITMNPSYAGRVELPDNLKSLFRPVAMTTPDFDIITEVILFSEGFTTAGVLSNKLVQLYELSSKQLSQQHHYDFGLRAIKAVLQMAGEMRQNKETYGHLDEMTILVKAVLDSSLPKFIAEDITVFFSIVRDLFPMEPVEEYHQTLLQETLREVMEEENLQPTQSLINKTIQLYNTIVSRHGVMQIGSTGGGKTTSRNVLVKALARMGASHPIFNEYLSSALAALYTFSTHATKLQSSKSLRESRSASITESIVNFDELQNTTVLFDFFKRIGCLGEERSSSSFSFVDFHKFTETIKCMTLNPKSVALEKLYGQFDKDSNEWSDGILAIIIRKFSKEQSPLLADGVKNRNATRQSNAGISPRGPGLRPVSEVPVHDVTSDKWKWLVLDGPVDSLWVENLNTVLDDTKTLCLANGERIQMSQRMRIILEHASPATISRCGMVYMDPVHLGWRPFVDSWRTTLPPNIPNDACRLLLTLMETTIDPGLEFLTANSSQIPIKVSDVSLVETLCCLISSHLSIADESGLFVNDSSTSNDNAKPEHVEEGGAVKRKLLLHRHPEQILPFMSKMYFFCFVSSFGYIIEGEDDIEDNAPERSEGIAGLSVQFRHKVQQIWSNTSELGGRVAFDMFVRDLFDLPSPAGVRLPSTLHSCYSYYFDIESGQFLAWENLVPVTGQYIEDAKTGCELSGGSSTISDSRHEINLPLPTLDTVRIVRIAELLLNVNSRVLVTGHPGCGKTALVEAVLKRLNKSSIVKKIDPEVNLFDIAGMYATGSNIVIPTLSKADEKLELGSHSPQPLFQKDKEYTSVKVQLNGQSSANSIESFFNRTLSKLGRDVVGPPFGKSLIVFFDDLNMPKPETFGAQPSLEFIRQFLNDGGYYDAEKLTWKKVQEVNVAAACSIRGTGSNMIPSRLAKHFGILNMAMPSPATLLHILESKMGRYFSLKSFTEEVQRVIHPVASAALYLYQQAVINFKPRPSTLHYVFNMHSLHALYQGMISCSSSDLTSQDMAVRLYVHEASRVFCDKLATNRDQELFKTYLVESMQKYFKDLATKMVFTKRYLNECGVMFTDFHSSLGDDKEKKYRLVNDHQQLVQTLIELQNRFNVSESEEYHLVFFEDAIQHLTRLCRALRHTKNHVLQIGVGGTGRAVTARLGAFISGCTFKTLKVKRNYTSQDLRDELKRVLSGCGVNRKPTLLFINELNILQDSFLTDLDALISNESMMHWYDNEDKEYILNGLKLNLGDECDNYSREELWSSFFQNIADHLHVVLSISPNSPNFSKYFQLHPSFLKHSYVDFYTEWPEAALLSVANIYFKNSQLDTMLLRAKAATTSANGSELNPALARAYGQLSNADKYLKEVIEDQLGPLCMKIHCSVQKAIKLYKEKENRTYFITPSSYLEFLDLYLSMLDSKNHQLNVSRSRLMNGIKALNLSSAMIERMSDELKELEPQLQNKAKLTELLLAQLEDEKKTVDNTKEVLSREQAAVNRENIRISKIAAEAEADLSAAIPSLERAICALDALDKQDISEIRVYNSPPEMVRKVIEAVCVILKEKPTWASAKQLLGDPALLKRLTNFDKDNIPLKSLTRLQTYTESSDFTPENVGKISLACKSLCLWVLAIENYAKVYRYVMPKKQKFQESMEHLKNAQKALEKKEIELQGVVLEMENLLNRYNNTRLDRDKLQERIVLTSQRRDRAKILIKALSGEKARWQDLVDDINNKAPSLVGDTMLCSAAVVYMGAFTQSFRSNLLEEWREFCNEHKVAICDKPVSELLTTPIEEQRWYTQGLQRDPFSTENAALLTNSHRWPLLLDPQGQGKKWLLGLEENLTVIPYGSSKMVIEMEQCIRMGTSVLIEGLPNYIDSVLYPILDRRSCELKGTVPLVGVEIEYNNDFRLYLSTNLSNPDYSPEDCIKVTIINFTVTFSGLEEQLLSRVVKMERPWLEQQKDELLKRLYNDNVQLRQLEDNILNTLSAVQTDILDDEDLVNNLNDCKNTADEIERRLEEAKSVQTRIDHTRKKYLPVATRGAIIYFTQSQLNRLNCMYNYSLQMFLTIYKRTIYSLGSSYVKPDEDDKVLEFNFNTASRDKQLDFKMEKHVHELMESITCNLHKQVICSLYSRYHLVYTMMLCVAILRHSGTITDVEWETFLHGGALKFIPKTSVFGSLLEDDAVSKEVASAPRHKKTSRKKTSPAGRPIWLTSSQWEGCLVLESVVPAFQGLTKNMVDKPEFWQMFMVTDNLHSLFESRFRSDSNTSPRTDSSLELISEDSDIENSVTPAISTEIEYQPSFWKWHNLTPFQKLMILRIMRKDKISGGVRTFITKVLGRQYVAVPPETLANILTRNSPAHPILFILSPGVDPSSQLEHLRRELVMDDDEMEILSAGRGQGARVEETLRGAMARGKWVFLQNCHFGKSWIHNLQRAVYSMQTAYLSPGFRLWLSSMPDKGIPDLVVQQSVKVAVEQPQGIKANLLQTFASGVIEESLYNDKDAGDVFKKLIYNLCLFNSVVLERRKYGPLGWNIPYEFTNSDLEACVQVIHQLLTEHTEVPWKGLLNISGTVIYGGRVTDKWDQRTLNSILNKFLSPVAVQPGHRFTSSESYTYHGSLPLDDLISYISSLPNYDSPELFGMHGNAEKAYNESVGIDLINFLSDVSSSSDFKSAISDSDSIVLKFLVHVHDSLPPSIDLPFSMPVVKENTGQLEGADRPPSVAFEKGYLHHQKQEQRSGRSPLENYLHQEVKHFNLLLETIHSSIVSLGWCVQGTKPYTSTLDKVYRDILENKIPLPWKDVSYESEGTLSLWLDDLVNRIQFLMYWRELYVEGSSPYDTFRLQYSELLQDDDDTALEAKFEDVLKFGASFQKSDLKSFERVPRSIWLGGLFHPQGFLIATLQSYARRKEVPIDTLRFEHYLQPWSYGKEETDKALATKLGLKQYMWGFPGPDIPDEGMFIHGLYLDGGRWDGKQIVESLPGKQTSLLPEVHFLPCQNERNTDKARVTKFECPVYKTSRRCEEGDKLTSSHSFVTSMFLDAEEDNDHWITRGLAILAQGDD